MQPFDFDAYIANRTAADNKLQEVIDASKEKQAQLSGAGEEKKAELGPSWVEQLGLAPGGFIANRVNDAASLVSGATRLAGQTFSLPVSLTGAGMAHDASPEDYDAYNRVLTNKATAEDWARLNQRTAANNSTILEGLQAQDKAHGIARDINDTTDLTGIVNQHNRQGLNQDLARGFGESWGKVTSGDTGQVIRGLGGLIANAGSALVHNPGAVREYVLENAPQLFVGAYGKAGQAAMLASNVGYAVDEYQKGIENWQKANGGALPPEDVRNRMALQAASLAIAEEGGDLVGLNAAKLLGKEAEGVTRASLLQSMKNVGRAAFEGAAGETPTEAYQTYAEGQIEGKPATPLEIYQSGVIGGASGGVLSGGGRFVHEAALPAGEKAAAPATPATAQVNDLRKQAIESGDVSALSDVKRPDTYAPDHAIAALHGNSKKPETTDAVRAENLSKADKIVSDLEILRSNRVEELATPQQKQAKLDALKHQLAATPAKNTDLREAYEAAIQMAQSDLEAPGLSPAEAKKKQEELARIDKQLARAKQYHGSLQALVSKPAEAAVSSLLDAAEANDTQATEKVINLSMSSPGSLDPVRLQKLAANTANGLSTQQRDYLRQFAEARIAQNALRKFNDVGKEIVEGTPPGKASLVHGERRDNLGLQQYQAFIGSAVASGDQKTAQRYLALLQNFAASHTDKARKVLAAEGMKGDKHVARLATGGWEIRDGHLPEPERRANGAVNVFPNKRLGGAIHKEAGVISATSAALQTAYATKFNPATTTTTATQAGAANVQNVSPEGANPGSEHQAAPVQGSGEAGEASQPVEPVAAAAPVAKPLEGAGVGVQALDTDAIYQAWSNTRDGSDRAAMRGQMAFVDKGYAGKVTAENREDIRKELRTQFKWFRSATKQQQDAALDSLMPAKQVQATTTTPDDAAYAKAVAVVTGPNGTGSVSLVQRHLKVGYNKAAEFLERMEKEGIVGPLQANGQREVLGKPAVEPAPLARTVVTPVDSSPVDRVSDASVAQTPVDEKTQKTSEEKPASTQDGSVSRQEASPADELGKNPSTAESSSVALQQTDTPVEPSITESPEATTEVTGLKALADGKKYNEQFKGKKLGEIFRKLHRAAAWLIQKATPLEKARDISQVKPLVSMPNFLERWLKEKGLVDELFENDLTEEEQHALLKFRTVAGEWAEKIRANFIKGSLPNSKGNQIQAEYAYKDPLQDFFNEDGTLDENVVTAIAYGAYSWLMEATMGPARKTKDAILAMHGLKPGDAEVTFTGQQALNLMAALQNTALNGMGRLVVDALGLKANEDASQDYLPNLTAAFGAHVLRLLEDQGHIQTKAIDGAALNQYIDGLGLQPLKTDAKGNPVYETRYYVQVTREEHVDEDGKKMLVLPDAARAMRDATIGSGGVLDRLFSAGQPRSEASTRPIPFTQEEAKRTDQGITEEQRQIIEAQQKVPHRIIPAMHKALQVLGRGVFLQAAGWQQLGDDKVQAENRDAVQTQNQNLESQLDDAMALVDAHPEGTGFYIAHEVWKNFRVGVATRNLNPQSSKLHRFMFARPEWKATIDLTNEEMVTHYLTAMAQAFGVKVDQQSNDKSAQWVLDWMNDPANTLVDLVDKLHQAAQDGGKTELTPAEQQAIGEFAASKEGMQTLQALVSLGEYRAAFNAEGVTSFDTTMLVGVDGKANGPMLTLLSLGAAPDAEGLYGFLNRGGFYRASDEVTNYSQWYGPENQDLYQDLAGKILGAMDIADKAVRTNLRGLSAITKKLLSGENGLMGAVTSAGRNLAKTPQTAFNFGSTLQKSVSGMTDALVQGVFDRIEALATDPGVAKEGLTREKLIAAINHFIADSGEHIPTDVTIEELMGTTFSKEFKAELKAGFTEFLGPVVERVMKDYYAGMIERRNALNGQVRTAFAIYNQVYQDLRERELQRLMDAGEIAFDPVMKKDKDGNRHPTGERRALHDMTGPQEAALVEKVKAVLPLAHNAYSQKVDDLSAGLYMAKTQRTTGRESFHEVVAQFGQKFKNADGQLTSQLKVRPLVVNELSPGVAALAYLMHSFDSAVMHRSIKGTQTLNVHDEAANAADKVTTTARSINFQLWESLVQFSPNTSAFQMLERSITNLVALAKDGTVSAETLAAIRETLRGQIDRKLRDKIAPENLASFVLARAKMAQYEADKVRLEALVQMTSVDQYTWEGGEYRVTDKDRAEVQKLLELHVEQGMRLSKETQAAADELGKLMTAKKTAEAQPTPQRASETTAEPQAQPQGSSPFGELGKSSVESDKDLGKVFQAEPVLSAERVIQGLYRKFKNDKGQANREFNLALLQRLHGLIGKSMTVRLVTPQTKTSDVLEMPSGPSRAWFVSKDGKQEIYVLDPQFADSGLTPETLLHEMVHAALAQAIANPSTEAKELIKDLETLRSRALAFAQEQKLDGQFQAALSNTQEFVAWGMTHKAFQDQVLQKISMQSKTKKAELVTGMKAFIKTLVDLVFGHRAMSSQAITVNGMTVLIGNVSGLIAAAEQKQAPKDDPLNLSMAAAGNTNTYSTLDIFEALDNQQGDITPSFSASLRELLGGVVDALHGPFGTFKAQLMQNTQDGELGVWFKAMLTGKLPFASKAIAAGFRVSDQELFAIEQVEATVRAAMDGNEAQTKVAARELADLYQQVYKRLKPADFEAITSSPAEARALYDFVFKMEKSSGDRSDYLARFASLALGHQGFNSLLKVATTRDGRSIKDGKSFAEKVQIVFENILAYFRDKVTETFAGQHEDAKVKALVEQLVDIEAKQREKLANPDVSSKVVSSLEEGAKSFVTAVRDAAGKALDSAIVRKSKHGLVKGAGAVARSVVGGHVDALMTELANYRDRNSEGQQDTASGLLNEVRGPSAIMEMLLRLRKRQEGERKDIISGTAKMALSLFAEGGKKIDKKANKAVTQVLLRTGAHTLLEDYGMARLEALLGDRDELEAEIAALEGQLPAGTLGNMMVFQAKTLAYTKVEGTNRSPLLHFNAHNIARMLGTDAAEQITPSQAEQAEKVLEKLISLYGLSYSDAGHVTLAYQVLKAENARTDGGNGVQFILQLASRLQADALERNFRGDKTLMVHGYTPEIYNPHVDVKTANEREGRDLVAQGYHKGEEVRIDPHDPQQERKHLYVMRDGPQQPWLSGIQALTGMRAKGSEMHSGYLNLRTQAGLENAQMNADVLAARGPLLQRAAQIGRSYDPRKDNQRFMAPVFNQAGEITNWRDLMLEETKNTLLERDNRFEVVLGQLAGSVFDKATAKEVNRMGIEAAKRRYDDEFAANPDAYMEVGPKSDDPQLREIWHLMPDETQAIVREVWGRKAMMVRKDELDIMFGYRKLSLADAWDQDPAVRNLLQKMLVSVAEEIFGQKAAMRIRQGERAWQEVVKEAKDNIVVKTGTVLLGNIWSNLSLLWLRGVPLKDMLHHHLVALKGATAYMDDSAELRRLKLLRDTGHTQGKDYSREILRLEDAIARNPVTKLMEAGLMPSIVDDVENTDDIYSYKSLFTRTTEKYTDKLNPTVKEAAKSMYMAHDTKLYQALSRATQLSDFVARYTLYQHLTTKKDAMTSDEALHDASESFINYDVPAHRKIQYGNDVGLLMFTKYFLRIQRVLAKASKENPLRYYAMLGMSHFLSMGPIVLDSLWINKAGNNPLRLGALDYPATLGNLGLINLEMSVFK